MGGAVKGPFGGASSPQVQGNPNSNGGKTGLQPTGRFSRQEGPTGRIAAGGWAAARVEQLYPTVLQPNRHPRPLECDGLPSLSKTPRVFRNTGRLEKRWQAPALQNSQFTALPCLEPAAAAWRRNPQVHTGRKGAQSIRCGGASAEQPGVPRPEILRTAPVSGGGFHALSVSLFPKKPISRKLRGANILRPNRAPRSWSNCP